jgi:hypothetical protein
MMGCLLGCLDQTQSLAGVSAGGAHLLTGIVEFETNLPCVPTSYVKKIPLLSRKAKRLLLVE